MVAGNKRSRTARRVKVRTPGGKMVIHYRARKHKAPRCGITGQVLPGVARGNSAQVHRLSKSERIPSRPYAGNLGSSAMRKVLLEKALTLSVDAKEAKGFGPGVLCMKLAGRDGGNLCVIVDVKDHLATIDGNVRRRTCNLNHLHPIGKAIEIKKGASHEDVVSAFKKLNLAVWEKKKKEKQAQVSKEKKASKKTVKKVAKKKAAKATKESKE